MTEAMRVAVLRCERLPRFISSEGVDLEPLFDDDRRLIDAFVRRGVDAASAVWSDDQDWSAFDLAVLRSTWDYIDRLPEFLRVLTTIQASGCPVRNPIEAVRWNSDKRYLDDLATRQVPVVPVIRADPSDPAAAVRAVAEAGWDDVVMKPPIGVGGAGVTRLRPHELSARLASAREVMLVQPFASSVVDEGEYSYVVLGGQVSHVVRKRPARGDFRAHGTYGATIEPHLPDPEDLAEMHALAALLPFDPDYARIDVVRFEGRLAVLELELIEPMLYLSLAPGSADRLAAAVLRGDAARTA